MTSIKKQATRDANELFEADLAFQKIAKQFTEKGRANSTYASIFDKTYRDAAEAFLLTVSPDMPSIPVAVVEPVKRRGLRINKTFVVGVLIGVAVHELELDKLAIAKAKQAYKRFAR